MLTYLDEQVVISSIFLICCSKKIKNQFCSNFADHSLRKFSYHDEFIGVTGEEFHCFFPSLTGKSVTLNSDNELLSTFSLFSRRRVKEGVYWVFNESDQ
ncbi:hypothetical protein GEMRC1_005083 [Eukaryota sp. GEM-RC1]